MTPTQVQLIKRMLANAQVFHNIEEEAKRVQAIADTIQVKRIESGRFE